jgi:hypothetical protein
LPVSGFLARTSKGQTSIQAVHYSRHFDSSTITGTSTLLEVRDMIKKGQN